MRNEFWKWYLQCVQETDLVPNQRFLSLIPQTTPTLQGSAFSRSQSSNTSEIRTKIEAVIAATKQDLVKQFPTSNWTRLNIDVICMTSGVSLKAAFSTNTQSELQPIKLTYYLQSGDKSSAHLMSAVKRIMYEQAIREGAWMQCSIVVQSSGAWTTNFNYDEIEQLPENKRAPDYLQSEFQKFPRSKEFTPSWWKAIVQNKVSYHE